MDACRLLVVATTFAALGCGEVLGLNDYRVGGPGCPGGVLVDGECRLVKSCNAGEIPTAGGDCEQVGARDCGSGFDGTEAVARGCVPILATDCNAPQYPKIGVTGCAAAASCGIDAQRNPFGLTSVSPGGRTIAETLATGAEGVLIGTRTTSTPGIPVEITENLSLDRATRIEGQCPDVATLNGQIDVRPTAGGTRMYGITVHPRPGSAFAIRIAGAADVAIENVRILGDGSPGIVIEGTTGDIVLDNVVIDGAAGAGVALWGAGGAEGRPGVTMRDVRVINTSAAQDGLPGRGIAIHALPWMGAIPGWAAGAGDPPLDPTASTRSSALLENVLVTRSEGIGILVEGSDATIDASVVTDTTSDRDGKGRGVEVRERTFGNVPAALTLRRSVVERSYDVGVRVDNASATIEHTTIRGVGSDAEHLGNGVRLRVHEKRQPPQAPDLALRNSLVEGTHESAVHVEGAWAHVEHSILRETNPRGEHARSVAVYGYDFAPAHAEVQATLVEGAGIVVFPWDAAQDASSATLNLDRSVVRTCAGTPLAAAPTEVEGVSICECEGLSRCEPSSGKERPAMLLWGPCDSATTPCFRQCQKDFGAAAGGGVDAPIQDFSAWALDRDDLATVIADELGCTVLALPPRETTRVVYSTATPAPVGIGRAEVSVPLLQSLTPLRDSGAVELPPGAQQSTSYMRTLAQLGANFVWDLRNSVFTAMAVCDPPGTLAASEQGPFCGRPSLAGSAGPAPDPAIDLSDLAGMSLTGVGRLQSGVPGFRHALALWNGPVGNYQWVLDGVFDCADDFGGRLPFRAAVPLAQASGKSGYGVRVHPGFSVVSAAMCITPP